MIKIEFRISKIVLSVVLAAFGSSACADWLKVTEKNVGETVARLFVDPASLRTNGNLRRVMTLSHFEESGISPFAAVASLLEFDCWDNRVRVLSYIMREGPMGQGNSIEVPAEIAAAVGRFVNVWDRVPAGRWDEAALNYACAR